MKTFSKYSCYVRSFFVSMQKQEILLCIICNKVYTFRNKNFQTARSGPGVWLSGFFCLPQTARSYDEHTDFAVQVGPVLYNFR